MILNNDQRKKRRFRYEAVIWHDNILPDRFYTARILNISRSGLYFESDQTLYQGEEIYIANKNPSMPGGSRENCTRVEIKWRDNLKESAHRYGYGATFKESDNVIVKSIDKTKLVKDNIRGNRIGSKNEPRAHLREIYRKEIVFFADGAEHKGVVTDISRGGAFIRTPAKLSLGRMVKLFIQGSHPGKDTKISGWVVRLSLNGIGVKFDRRLCGNRRKKSDRREKRA